MEVRSQRYKKYRISCMMTFLKNLRFFIMGVYEYLQIGFFILDPWDRLFIKSGFIIGS
jgi:hypothetical protein